MTRYPSHPSRVDGKPRAASPRMPHDYRLLAATVAAWSVPPGIVCAALGFVEDYADRLLRSGAGRAFVEWFGQQPEEFIGMYMPNVGNVEERPPEEFKVLLAVEVSSDAADALTKFLRDSDGDD